MAFAYRARDPLGNLIDGTLEALSAAEASQQLRRDGLQVLALDEVDEAADALFPRRIKKQEVIYATSQLSIMVDTGVTLSAALEGLAAQQENPTFAQILKELKQAVEQGEDFSAALARYPRLFDKTYVALMKVSEATGSMGPMLERVAAYMRKELETRGKVRAALAYPTVMLAMAIGVTVFLLTFVMPKFTPLFARKGVTLPGPTRVTMAISTAMIDYWYVWLALLAALVAGFVFGRRTEPGRQAWDWVKIHLPVTGTMMRKVAISRGIRTLGTMLSSGIPMLDALRLTAEVSANYYYETLWQTVEERVTTGGQVHEGLAESPLFPKTLVQMIAAGEQTGKLGPVLERVSDYYDQEVEMALKTATSMIEPIMISVMGVVVGGIGLSLLLPIFSLSRSAG